MTLDGALGTGRGELVRIRRTGRSVDAAELGRGAGEELLAAAGIRTRHSTGIPPRPPVTSEESIR